MRLHVHEWGDPSAPRLVCLHGVTAHGLRFRRLAEDRLASRFYVLAPDLRGHGRSDWEPPWSLGQLVEDVVETVGSRAAWLGHSLGGRLVLDLARASPDLVERAVVLDPAIQLLPNVALDLAQQQCRDGSFASVEEAIETRRLTAERAPLEFLVEEMEDHLVRSDDGRFRYRYCRAAVASLYGELAGPPGPFDGLRVPTLLVHASHFGLVRDDQLEAIQAAPGPVETVAVPGGHLVLWDAYEKTADAIDAFLD
jgi:lipase